MYEAEPEVKSNQKRRFHCPPREESGHLILPALICDNTHKALPTREAQLSLWCPEFLMGLDHVLPTLLTFRLQPLLDVSVRLTLSLTLQLFLEAELMCMAQSPKPPSSITL